LDINITEEQMRWMKDRTWSYKKKKMKKTNNDPLMGHTSVVEEIHEVDPLEFRDKSIVSLHV